MGLFDRVLLQSILRKKSLGDESEDLLHEHCMSSTVLMATG